MVGIIVQARMGSTRLPGKTMKKIMGNPLLYYSVKRSSLSKYANKIIVATTTNEADNEIVTWCKSNKILYYRGSEEDVLDRYYKAAIENNLKKVVRVTSDNPCVDPQLIDLIILTSMNCNYDYITLRFETNTWPYGLDVEIVDIKALERSWKEASLPEEREHVTMYIKNNTESFLINEISCTEKLANMRLTVDYDEDFKKMDALLNSIVGKYGIGFNWRNIHDEMSDISRCVN